MTRAARKATRFLAMVSTILAFVSCVEAQDCAKIASDYQQSVVSLTVEKTEKDTGRVTVVSGTGFIVSTDGYVLTANHVVVPEPDTDKLGVSGSIGSLYSPKSPLEVIVADDSKDIALLHFLDGSHLYAPVKFGNPFKVTNGSELCSLGYSAHINEDYHVTTGALSSRSGEDKARKLKTLWTTQMPSNFGESGSPVFERSSAMVVAIKYGGKPPGEVQNVNYLLPINLARPLLHAYCDCGVPDNQQVVTGPNDSDNTATLQSVQVTFITPKGDDKDFDTRVSVSITKGAIVIASNEDIAHDITFADPGNYGPFSLNVQKPVPKLVYKDSIVTLQITPNGHDRWITGMIIEAKFSDNQVIKTTYDPVILDQNVRTARFLYP